MAENVTGLLVEETLVAGVAEYGRAPRRRIGPYGLAVAILVALLIGGVAMHDRRASNSVAPAIPRTVTIQQARFLENNTTNLPNAVAPDVSPTVVPSVQQRFLDVNTTWLANAAPDVALAVVSSSQRRLVEVNTVMLPAGPSSPYAEDLTPTLGHPR